MRDSACLSAYFAMCNFMQLMFMQLQRYKTELFYLSLTQLCADLCVGKSAPISSLNWGGGKQYSAGAGVSATSRHFPEEWNENVINS